MRKARKELHEMAQRLDDELVELADEGMRDEPHQYQVIEEAIGIEGPEVRGGN
jgi:hypothetical protein